MMSHTIGGGRRKGFMVTRTKILGPLALHAHACCIPFCWGQTPHTHTLHIVAVVFCLLRWAYHGQVPKTKNESKAILAQTFGD